MAAKLPTEPVPEKPGMPLSGACGGAAWGTPASALREDSCPAPDLDASRKDLGGETSSPACPGQRAGREIMDEGMGERSSASSQPQTGRRKETKVGTEATCQSGPTGLGQTGPDLLTPVC